MGWAALPAPEGTVRIRYSQSAGLGHDLIHADISEVQRNASLFVQLFALVTPLFFQIVIDKVLVHKGVSTLIVIVVTVGLALIGLFDVTLQYLRAYALSHDHEPHRRGAWRAPVLHGQDGGQRDAAEPLGRRVFQDPGLEAQPLRGAHQVAAVGSALGEAEVVGKLHRLGRDVVVARDQGEATAARKSMRSAGAPCGREVGFDLWSKGRASSAGWQRL